MRKQFKRDGVTVTVRGQTGGDRLEESYIAGMLCRRKHPDVPMDNIPNRKFMRYSMFAGIVVRTEQIDGKLPFVFHDSMADDDVLFGFYETFVEADEHDEWYMDWINTMASANLAPSQDASKANTDPEAPSAVDG
jgi:hypothetical protein